MSSRLASIAVLAALGCTGPAATEGRVGAHRPAVSSTEAPTPVASASAAEEAGPAEDTPAPFRSTDAVSLWIRGGEVITGAAPKRRRADVVVDGAVIVHVGAVDPSLVAKVTIDATGLLVTPGFIDAHAHADPFGSGEQLLAQGVTTIVVGQDGFSPAENIKAFLGKVQTSRPRVNVATLVGHHTVRASSGVGASTKPAEKSIARMASLVERAMEDGAFGLSTGLEYEPGGLAALDELAKIAEPVGARGGLVMSHLRSEDDDKIEASLIELFDQCRRAKARAHIAHFKVVLGKGEDRAKRLLAVVNEARAGGLAVTADLYPYTASYTTVGILFPAFAKPPNDYGEARARRRDALRAHLHERVTTRNGPEAMLFGTGANAGKTLAEVAKTENRPFEDVLLAMGPSGGDAAYFVMDDAVMETLFKDKFVMIGTDGGGGGLHPRGHGSFARVIKQLVREKELASMEEAVRKMAALPAETLGMRDRGVIERGRAADMAIFDPAAVEDTATFLHPHTLAKGMTAVVVNGEVAYRKGRPTSARAGVALRHTSPTVQKSAD